MVGSAAKPFDAKAFLATLPGLPGVYRMLNADGEVLYVGKARNLKRRVASYFRAGDTSAKTRALVAGIDGMEVTVTHTETEALILENNLIKALRPRYNILLRDDKSYPYIYLSEDGDFPRLSLHRGARSAPGRYFGPYPSAAAVRETLNLLQKLFRVRQCEDAFFRGRSRPCLQHQIKRCSAPCVGFIDAARYAQDVRHAVMFLNGDNRQVIDELVAKMDRAAAALDYETAAQYRDRIASLRKVQERQYVSGERGEVDVVAAQVHGGAGCVEVLYIRGGRLLGDKAFFPRHPGGVEAVELLGAFLSQHYLGREIPPEILVSELPADVAVTQEALANSCGHKVAIRGRVRGERARWLEMAVRNAAQALVHHLGSRANMERRLPALQEALRLDALPQRIECFDVSHTSGEAAVASCVVFDQEGPVKADYRRYDIAGITPGDDYAALRQALTRRYTRIKKGEGRLPDLLFIDGGKGQVRQAGEVLEELQVSGVTVVGVAKGRERRPGAETLYLAGAGAGIELGGDAPALHLIQQIRDEAHRFALTGHRARRARQRRVSPLEGIPGIGPRRRRELLKQFGGWQGVARAGVEDLTKMRGIDKRLAQRIYDNFHGNERR